MNTKQKLIRYIGFIWCQASKYCPRREEEYNFWLSETSDLLNVKSELWFRNSQSWILSSWSIQKSNSWHCDICCTAKIVIGGVMVLITESGIFNRLVKPREYTSIYWLRLQNVKKRQSFLKKIIRDSKCAQLTQWIF